MASSVPILPNDRAACRRACRVRDLSDINEISRDVSGSVSACAGRVEGWDGEIVFITDAFETTFVVCASVGCWAVGFEGERLKTAMIMINSNTAVQTSSGLIWTRSLPGAFDFIVCQQIRIGLFNPARCSGWRSVYLLAPSKFSNSSRPPGEPIS